MLKTNPKKLYTLLYKNNISKILDYVLILSEIKILMCTSLRIENRVSKKLGHFGKFWKKGSLSKHYSKQYSRGTIFSRLSKVITRIVWNILQRNSIMKVKSKVSIDVSQKWNWDWSVSLSYWITERRYKMVMLLTFIDYQSLTNYDGPSFVQVTG